MQVGTTPCLKRVSTLIFPSKLMTTKTVKGLHTEEYDGQYLVGTEYVSDVNAVLECREEKGALPYSCCLPKLAFCAVDLLLEQGAWMGSHTHQKQSFVI